MTPEKLSELRRRGHGDRLTEAETSALIESYLGGVPLKLIAERFNISERSAAKRTQHLRGGRPATADKPAPAKRTAAQPMLAQSDVIPPPPMARLMAGR